MKSQTAKELIAKIIRSARLTSGRGISELGRAAGVSHSIISELEAGNGTLGPVTLQKLLAVLPCTPDERETLIEAAKATSSRMKTSPGIVKAGTDFDYLCMLLIVLLSHRIDVGPSDFYQGYGPTSGVRLPGYDLLIRQSVKGSTSASWIGFGFHPGLILLALTREDDYKALPDPSARNFEEKGGTMFKLG